MNKSQKSSTHQPKPRFSWRIQLPFLGGPRHLNVFNLSLLSIRCFSNVLDVSHFVERVSPILGYVQRLSLPKKITIAQPKKLGNRRWRGPSKRVYELHVKPALKKQSKEKNTLHTPFLGSRSASIFNFLQILQFPICRTFQISKILQAKSWSKLFQLPAGA